MGPAKVELPQRACAPVREERQRQLAQLRYAYRWSREPGLPPHLEAPGPAHALSDGSERYIQSELRRAMVNRGLARVAASLGSRPWTLDGFGELGPLIAVPDQARRRWQDDRYLGWSLVAGVNPMQLAVCESLPADLGVRDEHVFPLLCRGMTLGEAVAARRVFMTDFSAVEGLACIRGRYLAKAPRMLSLLDDEGRLRPLAITLRRDEPGRAPAPVFTPLDPRWDWLSARAWLQNASNHVHQAIYHLLETHLIAEVASLSMARNLAPAHPLHQLLAPHLSECVGINEHARELLLGAGGLVDRSMSAGGQGLVALIRRAWPGWRWSQRTLEADLAGRGVGRSADLPEYPYRDDARLVHGAITRFVTEFVRGHYGEDADVGEDGELRGWLSELGDPDGGTVGGLPRVETVGELTAFVSELLFKVSAQHSAMQYGQKEAYGFAPFTPAGLYAPAAGCRGATEASFLAMLPDHGHALSQLGSAHILARPASHPLSAWPRPDASIFYGRCLAAFHGDLRVVSATIEDRNTRRWLPYVALDPRHVSARVDI